MRGKFLLYPCEKCFEDISVQGDYISSLLVLLLGPINFTRRKCMEIKIPKEVRQHKETIFFGLSARQFFCAAIAVGLAVAVYLGISPMISKETASWLCILAAAPVALAGFFNYNGMTLEQFAWAFIKFEILCAGERRFISKNFHYELLKRKGGRDFD